MTKMHGVNNVKIINMFTKVCINAYDISKNLSIFKVFCDILQHASFSAEGC
jgi:hypothetical protein